MENIENKIFNNLTAIKYLFKYQREAVWECKCECGNITNVRISKLKNGTTKSCGCLKNKNLNKKSGNKHAAWKGYNDLSASFFNRIKATSLIRKIKFDITIEYIWDLYIKQNKKCIYTGFDLYMPINIRQLRGENNEKIASLDRIDSTKGYIQGNVQWICKRINYMKHTMKEEYFLDLIKNIYNYKIKNDGKI